MTTHNPAEALREAIIEECANAVAALMDEHRHSREWNDTINCAVVTVRELAALSPAPAGGEAMTLRDRCKAFDQQMGRKKLQDEIERIIISRLWNKRIDGYTMEMATQIVDTVFHALTPKDKS